MEPMQYQQFAAFVAKSGLEPLVMPCSGGWQLTFYPSHWPCPSYLTTARGDRRVFKSLDAVQKYLDRNGGESFRVEWVDSWL